MRDSMIIYRSFYEAIKGLAKEDQGEVWNAVYSYALDFKEVELHGMAKVVFTLIKPQLDANISKYKNGKKEKQNRSKTEANDKQEKAKNKQTVSKTEGNVNDNENVNENENKNGIETHNEIFRKLWLNRTWTESLAMLWKRDIKDILDHLNKFRLECILKEEYKTTEKDAKEHFVNWNKYNPLPDQGYVYKRPDLSSLERNPF
jgi:hypothetical protein